MLQQLGHRQTIERTVIAVVCLSGWLGVVVSAVVHQAAHVKEAPVEVTGAPGGMD